MNILLSNWNTTSLLRYIHVEARLCFWNNDRRRREAIKQWHLCCAAEYCPKGCPCEILLLNVNSLICHDGLIWSCFLHEARFYSFFFKGSSLFHSLRRLFFRSLVTLNWRFLKNRSFVPSFISFCSLALFNNMFDLCLSKKTVEFKTW